MQIRCVLLSQNGEYSNTSEIVRLTVIAADKWMIVTKLLMLAVIVAKHTPIKKVRGLADKSFGSSYYDMDLSIYLGMNYQIINLKESIGLTEV